MAKFSDAPKMLTPIEAAERLQWHPDTVRRLLRAGKFPGEQIAPHVWRVPSDKLDDYIREKKIKTFISAPTEAERKLESLIPVVIEAAERLGITVENCPPLDSGSEDERVLGRFLSLTLEVAKQNH